MTKGEKLLTAILLEKASDIFSNHGCNDLDISKEIPSHEERLALIRAFHAWNGDPEELEAYPVETEKASADYLSDWCAMLVLADLLRTEAGSDA